MTQRPTNHVTRAIDAFRSGPVVELPKLDEAAMLRLEALYPPRCLGRSETVEEHLRYCGMVELVANLRACLEQDDTDNTDPERYGERAS